MVKSVTVEELKQLIDKEADIKLIDVREPHEVEIASLGAQLIPLGDVLNQVDQFKVDAEMVIVHCRSGKRSADAIELIQSETGLDNLYNLEGGILAWADQIDQTITKY